MLVGFRDLEQEQEVEKSLSDTTVMLTADSIPHPAPKHVDSHVLALIASHKHAAICAIMYQVHLVCQLTIHCCKSSRQRSQIKRAVSIASVGQELGEGMPCLATAALGTAA